MLMVLCLPHLHPPTRPHLYHGDLPQPGIKPLPLEGEAWNLSPCTTREAPVLCPC